MTHSLKAGVIALSLVLCGGGAQAQDAHAGGSDAGDAGPETVEPPLRPAEELTPAPGLVLQLTAPSDWAGGPTVDLSHVKVSEIPGAKLVLSRTWRSSKSMGAGDAGGKTFSDEMTLVCVSAPAIDWAPGLQSVVFERMNVVTQSELSEKVSLDRFEPATIEDTGQFFRQYFKGRAELAEGQGPGHVRVLTEDRPDRPHDHARIRGVHVLTVPKGSSQIIACSASCGETERPDQKAFVCDGSVASFKLLGVMTSEPPTGMAARIESGVRHHPLAAVGWVLGLLLFALGLVFEIRGWMQRSAGTAPDSEAGFT